MNKEKTKAAIEIMQAFLDGKTIQVRRRGCKSGWVTCCVDPWWDWHLNDYRVKPEKHVRYINQYSDRRTQSRSYTTREEADKYATRDRIACLRIEFYDGEYSK